MTAERKIGVIFVCTGNICRSPMAEAIFRHLVQEAGLTERFRIDSAGTGGWHTGERPHRGTMAILERNGVAVGDQRARQLVSADLSSFDYVIAMDREHMADMAQLNREAGPHARLLLDYADKPPTREVPDPYYNGNFAQVYDLVLNGCRGLLAHIREREGL